jgi:tetratricopeptide (TPR) repeat protein
LIEGKSMMDGLCSEAELQELMAAMQSDAGDELEQADRLISDYPDDPRLHFLRGSILASIGRPIEALPALRQAVELAPDFAIARFQLGFFQLTSGEAANALSTWGPLALLPEDNYLRMFVAGLTHLIRDEFEQAIVQLRAGIAVNDENPPLNRDMQLIIEQASALAAGAGPEAVEGEAASATSFLLDQLSGGSGKAN